MIDLPQAGAVLTLVCSEESPVSESSLQFFMIGRSSERATSEVRTRARTHDLSKLGLPWGRDGRDRFCNVNDVLTT